jgi:hypothetical protein
LATLLRAERYVLLKPAVARVVFWLFEDPVQMKREQDHTFGGLQSTLAQVSGGAERPADSFVDWIS